MIAFNIICDEYNKKFEILDDIHPGDIAVINKETGDISPLFRLDNISVISKDVISINDKEIHKENLELSPLHQIAEDYLKAESVYLKSIEECLPNPNGYTGIHKAALNAMKISKPLALTQTQHNRKLSLIRELEKVGNGTKNTMSIQRIEELISYYSLTIEDLLKTSLL